jgi:hypothetical protein
VTGEKQELMLRIIDLCNAVEQRGLDPFDVRVKEFFDRLRELLPKLKKNEDLYLDIQAVLGLAEVVFQQGEWIKHKSSLLYLDPLLIMLKIHALPPEDLAEVFAKAWHPVVELESISPHGFREAKGYWTELLPMDERWRGLGTAETLTGEMGRGELKRMGMVSEEEFIETMEKSWRELKEAAGGKGQVDYWDFIMGKTFEKTVSRAWLVSFLVSYGYATVDVKPLEEEIILTPMEKPRELKPTAVFSLPIAISYEEWTRRRKDGKS